MVRERRRITIEDVRRSFDAAHGRTMPACAVYFGRPAADLITPLFYNTGWTANGVTMLRTLVSFAALACLGSGRQPLLFAAGALALFAFVLDYVDGHLARLDDNATYWGKFADGLGDYIFPAFGMLAVGCGLWMSTGQGGYMLAGGAVTCVVLSVRVVRDRFRYFESWMAAKTGPLDETQIRRAAPWRRGERLIAGHAANVRTAALLLLFVPDGGVAYFWVALAVQGASEAVWLGCILRYASVELDRWRRSDHAAK
jgi:phosphatidylglycerophosphate synthase